MGDIEELYGSGVKFICGVGCRTFNSAKIEDVAVDLRSEEVQKAFRKWPVTATSFQQVFLPKHCLRRKPGV